MKHKGLIKQEYRINMWRQGTAEEGYLTFEVEGSTLEACDDLARQRLKLESDKPENIHEGMNVVRIDSPAVAEKTTFLGSNGRQECKPE